MSAVLLTQWARLLIDSFVQSGVREAVISPGSRSTPLTWAALEHPKLRCHSVIDERCAAFFALGQAKATGQPSLLIATSGSACAHYQPALVEARYAGVPLLVLTADRPPELLYRAAPQTIDQHGVFGSTPRAAFDLGVPEWEAARFRALQATVAQAVRSSRDPEPGPVHLNAPARKPLAPAAAATAAEQALQRRVAELIELGPTRWFSAASAVSLEGVAAVAEEIKAAQRGLIVCGALPAWQTGAPSSILGLARVTGFPVLGELPSQLIVGTTDTNVCAGIDNWLRTAEFDSEPPDLVLELGAPLTGQAWSTVQMAFGGTTRRHLVATHAWPDVPASARTLHRGDPALFCDRLSSLIAAQQPSPETVAERRRWAERCRYLSANAQRLMREVLESLPFGEPHAVQQICANLPQGSRFIVGNSLPVRAVDAFALPKMLHVKTIVQRGANGIDGLVSGASGVASVGNEPTTLLLGDVSFAHDVGGLLLARAQSSPLLVVVIDNGGGRIFEQLPMGLLETAPATQRDFWLTPPRLDLAHLAAAYGIGYRRVQEASELSRAMQDGYANPSASLIHVEVAAESYQEAQEQLRQRLSQLRQPAGGSGAP